jgi:DNA-3-methyladenine glycosylase I
LILTKRDGYRQAFDGFDANKVARYDDRKVQELLTNPEIVRNKLKISATIQNARAFLQVQSQFGSFDVFIWQFVAGQPMQNAWRTVQEVPAKTRESDAMSKELKRRGFTFVGSTICYAFMQAVGMVNDHIVECFRWQEVQTLAR